MGRIVNITSCAGLENSGPVTFTTAKASLTAYTRSMGRCLAIDSPGVVMTAVYPGVIITPGGHWDEIIKNNPSHAEKYISERCPLGRFGEIDEFVPTVLFCVRKFTLPGSIIGVDGDNRNILPSIIMSRRMKSSDLIANIFNANGINQFWCSRWGSCTFI